jgi:hypothetical protein
MTASTPALCAAPDAPCTTAGVVGRFLAYVALILLPALAVYGAGLYLITRWF